MRQHVGPPRSPGSWREAVEAWRRAEETARFAESALTLARANLAAARERASERRRIATHAAAARQRAIARWMAAAADAHDENVGHAEAAITDLEARRRELRRIADERHAALVRTLQGASSRTYGPCTGCLHRTLA